MTYRKKLSTKRQLCEICFQKNVFTIFNLDRKRTGPPLSVPVVIKKPKNHTGSSHSSFSWEQMSIDVEFIDLIESLSYSIQNQENLKAVSLVKYLNTFFFAD